MTGDRRRERIDNYIFVSLPPTEFQAGARSLLGDLLTELAPREGDVVADPILDLGRSELQPDFAVRTGTASNGMPRLVVEVQRESTDRYALGIKRMAYGRAGIPEYWFVDPVHGRLMAMRLPAGEPEYEWPPIELRHGDVVPEGGFAAGLGVERLLPALVERYQPVA